MPRPTPRYHQAAALSREGHRTPHVAEALGVSVHAAHSLLRSARLHGISTSPLVSTALLIGMEPPIRAWLESQTPAGATVGDVILAIIIDAYYEDKEKC